MESKLHRNHNAPEKHIGYFALLEACEQHGCPLCRMLQHAAQHRIEDLLREEVTDGGIRRQLRGSFGFCSQHALMLLRSGDGFGIALIYRDVIESILNTVAKRKRRSLIPDQECPLCQSLNESAKNYIRLILRHLRDQELRLKLENSWGLCLPHFSQILAEISDGSLRRWLRHIEVQAIHRQRSLLQQSMLVAQAAVAPSSMSRRESSACRGAIDMLVGTIN